MMLLIPLTLAGFYKTYIVLYPNFNEKIDSYIHLHALVATIWILLLIIQPILIRYKRHDLHRKVGKLSYIIFPLLVLSFLPQMFKTYHSDDIRRLLIPGRDLVLLLIFYGLAIYNKKVSSLHMRYMISSALVFIFPTIGRITRLWFEIPSPDNRNLTYLLIYFILITLIILDNKNNRNIQPYLVSFVCILVSQAIIYLAFLEPI